MSSRNLPQHHKPCHLAHSTCTRTHLTTNMLQTKRPDRFAISDSAPFTKNRHHQPPTPTPFFCAALKPSLGQDSPLSPRPYACRRRQNAEPSILRDSVPQPPPSEQGIYAAPGLGFICVAVSQTRSRRKEGQVAYLALSVGKGNVDEAASVELALVGATLGRLLLLLGLDLLRFRFSSVCCPLRRGNGCVGFSNLGSLRLDLAWTRRIRQFRAQIERGAAIFAVAYRRGRAIREPCPYLRLKSCFCCGVGGELRVWVCCREEDGGGCGIADGMSSRMDFCQVRLAGDSTDPGLPRTMLPPLPAGACSGCRSSRDDPHGSNDPHLEVLMQSPVSERLEIQSSVEPPYALDEVKS